MNTPTTIRSIRLAYTLTRIGYILYLVAGIFMVLLFLYLALAGWPSPWRYSLDIPLEIDTEMAGTLALGTTDIPVHLHDLRANFGLFDPPAGFIWGMTLMALSVLALGFFALRNFLRFMTNIYHSRFFEPATGRFLRRTGLFLVLIWAVEGTTRFWVGQWLTSHLRIDEAAVSMQWGFDLALPLVALFLVVLSRIFDHGTNLEEENNLTI